MGQSLIYTVLFKPVRRMPWNVQYWLGESTAVEFARRMAAADMPFIVILDSNGNKIENWRVVE